MVNKMAITLYVILTCFACIQLFNGWKIKRTLQFQMWRKINPYSMFSKSESIILTNEPARIVAHGFIFNGIFTLVLMITNLFLNLIDTRLMFLMAFIVAVMSVIFTYNKACNKYQN